MMTMVNFATLVIATMFAVAAATALLWLFLKLAYVMMQPATARQVPARIDLERGTTQLARTYASHR
jgi:hypothetical protein